MTLLSPLSTQLYYLKHLLHTPNTRYLKKEEIHSKQFQIYVLYSRNQLLYQQSNISASVAGSRQTLYLVQNIFRQAQINQRHCIHLVGHQLKSRIFSTMGGCSNQLVCEVWELREEGWATTVLNQHRFLDCNYWEAMRCILLLFTVLSNSYSVIQSSIYDTAVRQTVIKVLLLTTTLKLQQEKSLKHCLCVTDLHTLVKPRYWSYSQSAGSHFSPLSQPSKSGGNQLNKFNSLRHFCLW